MCIRDRGNAVELDFDVENNSFVQTDRNGNLTTLEFDDRGNITREIDALGGETLSEYNDPRHAHLETAITDANGNTTRFTYDNAGNVTLLEEPEASWLEPEESLQPASWYENRSLKLVASC